MRSIGRHRLILTFVGALATVFCLDRTSLAQTPCDFKGVFVGNKMTPPELMCQSALEWAPRSASKRDPFVLRFRRLAVAPSELVGVAEMARARVGL